MTLEETLAQTPILPFMREGDFGVRRPWSVGERRLLDYLLFWVREGECTVIAEGHEHRFRAGEWCFVQPRTLLELRAEGETITPFAHFDIFYNPHREQSFPAPPGLLDLSNYATLVQPRLDDILGTTIPLRLQSQNSSRMRETFLKAVGAWQNRDALSQLEAQNRLADIVLSILRDAKRDATPTPAAPRSLDWLTSHLMLHLDEAISVEAMARRANLSPSRFSAAFRSHFGLAPHQYLTHLRITHAQELLCNSESTPAQIARFCGFADVQHFSKTFKLRTGQTPGAFRANKGTVEFDRTS
ncbi:MAG TPA: helix-turn-helix transcriptional regulator [Abditibacteriaceae bacterium]